MVGLLLIPFAFMVVVGPLMWLDMTLRERAARERQRRAWEEYVRKNKWKLP